MYVYVCVCVSAWVRVSACVRACVCARACVRMCVCVRSCMWALVGPICVQLWCCQSARQLVTIMLLWFVSPFNKTDN